MDSASGFLPGIFSGGKIYCYANFCCFQTKISGGGGGQKFLRGALRAEESQASDMSIMVHGWSNFKLHQETSSLAQA